MTNRKTLDSIKNRINNLSPHERINGLELVGIDKDPNGDIVIVSKQYVPMGKNSGEAWHEVYPEGDPRRVKWEGNA